jgi:hypothetical protein
LATRQPAAAATKALAVDTLNRLAPSPPVPTMSTRWRRFSITTGVTSSRITMAAPVISSRDSLFMRNATRKPPICASVAPPVMIWRITSFICSVDRSMCSTTAARASWIFMRFPPSESC